MKGCYDVAVSDPGLCILSAVVSDARQAPIPNHVTGVSGARNVVVVYWRVRLARKVVL